MLRNYIKQLTVSDAADTMHITHINSEIGDFAIQPHCLCS